MKTLFTIVLLCISTLLWGQNYTQKYNELYDRTEFYNSYGNLIGYAKYNSLYDRLEYYNANGDLLKTEQIIAYIIEKISKINTETSRVMRKETIFITKMKNMTHMAM